MKEVKSKMPEIGRWNGHKFEVSPTVIRGFTGLTIRGSSETDEKQTDGQKYVSRKTGKPMETSLSVILNAYTGCDVQREALAFVRDAKNSGTGYFYIGGKKLVPAQLMLVEAEASEITLGPGASWIHCKVNLTMKQCGKDDETQASTSSAGTKKVSVKSTAIMSTAALRKMETQGAETKASETTLFQQAVAKIKQTTERAKAASKEAGLLKKAPRLLLIK